MPKRTYKLQDFSGGLNWKRDPRDIANNELAQADYCYLDRIGGIRASGKFDTDLSNDFPQGTHTAGANFYAFESDHSSGASAPTTGAKWRLTLDGLDGTVEAKVLDGDQTTDISTGVDLGSVDSVSYNPGGLNFQPGATINILSGTSFDDANLNNGDFLQITGATTEVDRNGYFYGRNVGETVISSEGQGFNAVSGTEATIVTIKKLIRGVFFDAADDVRIADGAMSTGTKRKKYSYIKNIHFEDAGAAKNSYDDWYANDCSLNAPTELLLHATSYPTAGAGFHLTMTSTAGGSLPSKTYQIAGSFIYENGQESLLYIPSSSNTVSVTSNHYLDIDVRAENTADLTDGVYDERITGARVYIREDGTSESWTLAVDISMKDGARTTLDSEYSPWVNNSAVQAKVEGLQLMSENLETYTILNGFGPDEFSIQLASNGEGYKDAVVANRRVFVGNVAMIDEYGDGTEIARMRDRIMYTPINKFDTFPRSFFIDVVQGDADEYTALATYADRLFAYKANTLYIINISSPSPSNWFLESTERDLGVKFPCSVWTAKNGIYWANKKGAYWYNGSNITDLTAQKMPTTDEITTNRFHVSEMPLVWYDPNMYSLFIKLTAFSFGDKAGTATLDNGGVWVYNFQAQGWSRIRYENSGTETNEFFANVVRSGEEFFTGAITQHNGTASPDISSRNSNFEDELIRSGGNTNNISANKQIVKTKDIDFGDPSIIKKVYAVTVTYVASDAMTNPISYATDGGSSFTDFTGNFADTGTGDANDNWAKLRATLASPVECQSMQIKIQNTADGIFSINDITIEYRPIYKRVS